MRIVTDQEIAQMPAATAGMKGWGGIIDLRDPNWVQNNPVWTLLGESRIHEPEFSIFRHFHDAETFVDVGANCGQSIASFRSVNPHSKVVSFEPNRFCYQIAARYAATQQGATVHNCGVASASTTVDIYTPVIDGLLITPLAAIDPDTFAEGSLMRGFIEERAPGFEVMLHRQQIALTNVQDVVPDFQVAKIDVEGAELSVVTALKEKIEANRPLLMMERGDTVNVTDFLATLGYSAYAFHAPDEQTSLLTRLTVTAETVDAVPVNVIYVHDAQVESYRAKGLTINS